MTKKRNIIHPNFILGLLSQLLLFAAGIYIANNNEWGNTIAIIALIMAATHWVLSMIDAWKDPDLKNKQTGNFFWLSLIILIPPLAGLMYYMIHDKRVRF